MCPGAGLDCVGAVLAAVAGVSQEKLRCWVPEQSWQPGGG